MARRNRRRREKGQDLVEYALVLPVLLLLIAAIMWFAMLVYAKFTIGNAAREGARTGVVYFEDVDGDGSSDNERIAAITAAVLDMLRVEVHYDYELLSFLSQALGVGVPTLTSAVTMRME